MRFIPAVLLFFLYVIPPCIASEQESPPVSRNAPADFAELKQTRTARIDTVIDGLTVLLKDGKIVRLSGLEIAGQYDPAAEDTSVAAKQALETLLPEGTEVTLYQTRMAKKGRLNRMGHHLAHLEKKNETIWVQGALLRQGLAYALPTSDTPEMAAQMYAAESAARNAKTGLWENSSVLSPDTAEQAIGRFAVVEGVVRSAATAKNNIYLNFGSDWRTDFTVMIAPSVRKELARTGIDPLSLAGETIRTRGWLRSYNGPMLELDHPSLLEYPVPPRTANGTSLQVEN